MLQRTASQLLQRTATQHEVTMSKVRMQRYGDSGNHTQTQCQRDRLLSRQTNLAGHILNTPSGNAHGRHLIGPLRAIHGLGFRTQNEPVATIFKARLWKNRTLFEYTGDSNSATLQTHCDCDTMLQTQCCRHTVTVTQMSQNSVVMYDIDTAESSLILYHTMGVCVTVKQYDTSKRSPLPRQLWT